MDGSCYHRLWNSSGGDSGAGYRLCLSGDGSVGRSNTDELSRISGAILSDFTGWGHFFVRCYINRNPDQNGSISADRLFPDADSEKHRKGAYAFSSKGSEQHPVYWILFSGDGTSEKADLSVGNQCGRLWRAVF